MYIKVSSVTVEDTTVLLAVFTKLTVVKAVGHTVCSGSLEAFTSSLVIRSPAFTAGKASVARTICMNANHLTSVGFGPNILRTSQICNLHAFLTCLVTAGRIASCGIVVTISSKDTHPSPAQCLISCSSVEQVTKILLLIHSVAVVKSTLLPRRRQLHRSSLPRYQ
jgi:hypothetical protein